MWSVSRPLICFCACGQLGGPAPGPTVMPKLAAVVVAVLATSSVAAAQRTQPIQLERVVAAVDDAVILQSELDMRVAPLAAQVQGIVDPVERERRLAQLAARTLDEMVDEELVTHAAAAARIEISDAELQAAIDEIEREQGLDDRGLVAALQSQGYSLESYRVELRRQLVRLRAINQLVGPRVQIGDADVRARYDELQRASTTALAAFDQMKGELTNELRRRETERLAARWIEELRQKAYVVTKLK
jgi:parvulin-like peptidyl-prolyl isomerase